MLASCSEAKTGTFNVLRGGDEDVGGLEVAVDDAARVQVLEGDEHLGGVPATER